MNTTGIVRKVDQLGRIVVPIETRQNLCIEIGDPIEFFYDEDAIYMKKYTRGCIFCNSMEDIIQYKGEYVCRMCTRAICEELGTEPGKQEKEKLLAGRV